MKISRSLFLALTGSIAAATTAGCYVETPPPAPPPPPRVAAYYPPTTYPAPVAARPATTTYYYVNSQGQRVASRVVVRRRARPVGTAVTEPNYRPAPPALGVIASPSSEGGAPLSATPAAPVAPAPPAIPSTSVEGQACLDTSPMAVPDCSALKIDPGCGIKSFVTEHCQAYRDNFDAAVATVAVECMERMSSKQLCDAENTYDCGKQALSEACPDGELAKLCSIAASTCHTTATDCTALLSGLNDGAKQQVARCIASGCHAGLYSCVEGLAPQGKH